MQDLMSMLGAMRRPRLLIRAARLGTETYHRAPHLRRVLRTHTPPRSGAAIMALIDLEQEIERQRTEQSAAYSISRHVDVLIAIMGEARLVRSLADDACVHDAAAADV